MVATAIVQAYKCARKRHSERRRRTPGATSFFFRINRFELLHRGRVPSARFLGWSMAHPDHPLATPLCVRCVATSVSDCKAGLQATKLPARRAVVKPAVGIDMLVVDHHPLNPRQVFCHPHACDGCYLWTIQDGLPSAKFGHFKHPCHDGIARHGTACI